MVGCPSFLLLLAMPSLRLALVQALVQVQARALELGQELAVPQAMPQWWACAKVLTTHLWIPPLASLHGQPSPAPCSSCHSTTLYRKLGARPSSHSCSMRVPLLPLLRHALVCLPTLAMVSWWLAWRVLQ